MNSITDKDTGYGNFLAQFQAMHGFAVTVGIHQEDDYQPGTGASVLEYATFNEFGTSTIPARPFLTSTADEQKEAWAKLSGKLMGRVVEGKIMPRTAMELLGIKAQSDVRRKITTLREPPNTAATIARKGSSNPLIDTGTMRQLITYNVEKVTA